jgi:hypothetical protein
MSSSLQAFGRSLQASLYFFRSFLHFAIAFCKTNWHVALRKLLLTKLRGCDGVFGGHGRPSLDWLVPPEESNMQRGMLNRATMRVADTMDVSGRVTADEENLDRFHNRIRMNLR